MTGFINPEPVEVHNDTEHAEPVTTPEQLHHHLIATTVAGDRWCVTCRAVLAPHCDCDQASEHQPGCPLNPDEQQP